VGLYCLSTFRYITGEEPTEVTGNVTRPPGDPRFREIEDIAQFTMRFPPGVFASAASGYSFHEDRSFRTRDRWPIRSSWKRSMHPPQPDRPSN
jgi:predicted dehydrogenase